MTYAIDDVSCWRALHSVFIDALIAQDTENADAISVLLDGFGFREFIAGLDKGFLIAAPVPGPDGQPCVGVEVLADKGYVLLTRAPAAVLGLDPEQLEDALSQRLASAVEEIVEVTE